MNGQEQLNLEKSKRFDVLEDDHTCNLTGQKLM